MCKMPKAFRQKVSPFVLYRKQFPEEHFFCRTKQPFNRSTEKVLKPQKYFHKKMEFVTNV